MLEYHIVGYCWDIVFQVAHWIFVSTWMVQVLCPMMPLRFISLPKFSSWCCSDRRAGALPKNSINYSANMYWVCLLQLAASSMDGFEGLTKRTKDTIDHCFLCPNRVFLQTLPATNAAKNGRVNWSMAPRNQLWAESRGVKKRKFTKLKMLEVLRTSISSLSLIYIIISKHYIKGYPPVLLCKTSLSWTPFYTSICFLFHQPPHTAARSASGCNCWAPPNRDM